MQVAVLTEANASQYRSLMLHAYEHAPDAFTSTPEDRATQPLGWWLKRIADPAGMTAAFGAFEEGELVGSVALEFSSKPKTQHSALLIGMYVLPRGRGKGAARALLQAAIDYCNTRGNIRTMKLTVTQGNEAAIGLYRTGGFEVFGTEPMAILTPSGFKAKLHMWRHCPSGNTAA